MAAQPHRAPLAFKQGKIEVELRLSGRTMFPFWAGNWYCGESISRKSQLEGKLRFLKSMRDDLETRLAGVNAAIEQVERQSSREDRAA